VDPRFPQSNPGHARRRPRQSLQQRLGNQLPDVVRRRRTVPLHPALPLISHRLRLLLLTADRFNHFTCLKGSTTRNVLPFPTSLSTSITPPCRSTTFCASASPN